MEKIHHLLDAFSKTPTLLGFLLGFIIGPVKKQGKKKSPCEYLGDNLPFTLMERGLK